MHKVYLKKQSLFSEQDCARFNVQYTFRGNVQVLVAISQKFFIRKILCCRSLFEKLGSVPSVLFVFIITVYQWTLSPDHGIVSLYTVGRCKFRPTCSEYTKSMIKKYGLVQGINKGFGQIKKCY